MKNTLKLGTWSALSIGLAGCDLTVVGAGTAGVAAGVKIEAKAQPAPSPTEFDIATLQPGEAVKLEWHKQPFWVWRRTPAQINHNHAVLQDPHSSNSKQQPAYAKNNKRAAHEEIVVVTNMCTHLGCSVLRKAEAEGKLESGGFFCPCHGAYFDSSGRVYKGSPASANLVVPPHRFEGSKLIIGEHPHNYQEGSLKEND